MCLFIQALALCKLLDTAEGQQQIHLCDKTVLELGAGTGLLSVVVTLLGESCDSCKNDMFTKILTKNGIMVLASYLNNNEVLETKKASKS